jgi:5-methylthioadenosine/S-adenosylhomocysteine deaminase
MPAKRAIYRARWVLGFRDGGHRLIDNGEIAIEDSRVTYVGPRSVAPLADGVEVREFSEGILLPGFISSHAHICSHVGDRMMVDAGRLEMFSSGFLNYLPSGRDGTSFLASEDPCVGIRYAIGEFLNSGITTVVEMGGEVGGSTDAMVDIAGEMGIRAYIAPGFASAHYHFDEAGRLHDSWLPDEGEAQFEAACEAAIHNNGRYDDRILVFSCRSKRCSPRSGCFVGRARRLRVSACRSLSTSPRRFGNSTRSSDANQLLRSACSPRKASLPTT